MGKILSFCSGGGGTGKTSAALSSALCAVQNGKKVLFLDASGLARTADLLLGIESIVTLDLTDVLLGEADLKDALVHVPGCAGLDYLSASLHRTPVLEDCSGLLLALRNLYDDVVVDLPAGVVLRDRDVLEPADAQLIVLRPDAASIRAAETMLEYAGPVPGEISLVVNGLADRKLSPQEIEMQIRMTLDYPVEAMLPLSDSLRTPLHKNRFSFRSEEWKSNTEIRKLIRALF